MQKTGNFYITQYAIRSQSLKHVFEAVWEKKNIKNPTPENETQSQLTFRPSNV